jgi:hypothetical protein
VPLTRWGVRSIADAKDIVDSGSGPNDMRLCTSAPQRNARCAGAARGRCLSGEDLNGRLRSLIQEEKAGAVFRCPELHSNRAALVTQAQKDFPRLTDV